MRAMPSPIVALGLAAVAVPVAVWLSSPLGISPLELAGLTLVAMLASALAARPVSTRELDRMEASFVVDLTTFMLLGLPAAMWVAAAGEVARGLAARGGWSGAWRTLAGVATSLLALEGAGAVYWRWAARCDISIGRGWPYRSPGPCSRAWFGPPLPGASSRSSRGHRRPPPGQAASS